MSAGGVGEFFDVVGFEGLLDRLLSSGHESCDVGYTETIDHTQQRLHGGQIGTYGARCQFSAFHKAEQPSAECLGNVLDRDIVSIEFAHNHGKRMEDVEGALRGVFLTYAAEVGKEEGVGHFDVLMCGTTRR